MQGSIRQLISDLHSTNHDLKEALVKEKQKKAFLSTQLLDTRLSVREHKKQVEKLEKKLNRLRTLRKSKLAKMFKLN